MTRAWLFIFIVASLLAPAVSDAQHQRQGGQRVVSPQGFHYSPSMSSPFGFPGMGFGRHFGHHYGMPYVFGVYIVQPQPVTTYPYPIAYAPAALPPSFNADKPSTAASRLKSLDFQAKGDQRMREQKWGEARLAYANAVSAAPDQADAHFKLAVCYAVIQRFDSAIREFKRTLNLDPSYVKTAKSLKAILGPDSQIVRRSIVSKLGAWADGDPHSSDRQFLYGAMLRLDDDPKSREVLQAAMKENAGEDSSHIARFMHSGPDPNKGLFAALDGEPPAFHDKPLPVAIARPAFDLRFPISSTLAYAQDSPVPMPDGPVPIRDGLVPLPDAPVPMP